MDDERERLLLQHTEEDALSGLRAYFPQITQATEEATKTSYKQMAMGSSSNTLQAVPRSSATSLPASG